MIGREVKRGSFIKSCRNSGHKYSDVAIKDPVDKRRLLTPYVGTLAGTGYYFKPCVNCGCFMFYDISKNQ